MDRQLRLAGHVVKTGRQQVDDGRREDPADDANQAEQNHQCCGDAVRQAKGFLFSFDLLYLRERGDEGRRQRALGEQIAQQIGDAERGKEGVVL